MARPIKKGLDYFPLDVDFFTDDKVEVVVGIHGLKAENIILRLYSKIYKENGFWYSWGSEEQVLLSKRGNIALGLLGEIVAGCIKRGLFDETVFNRFGVLTSVGIQKRYFEILRSSKRKVLLSEVEREYLLINSELTLVSSELMPVNPELIRNNSEETIFSDPKKSLKKVNTELTLVNSELMPVNTELTLVNPELTTQSKVKKSKEKEIKIKQSNIRINSEETILENSTFEPTNVTVNFNFTVFDKNFFKYFKKNPTDFFIQKFEKWFEYKKLNGFVLFPNKKPTDEFFKKLNDISGSDLGVAAQAIENAIANKWQDVYPVLVPAEPTTNLNGKWVNFKMLISKAIPSFEHVEFVQMTDSIVNLRCTIETMNAIENSENFNQFKTLFRSHFGERKLNYVKK